MIQSLPERDVCVYMYDVYVYYVYFQTCITYITFQLLDYGQFFLSVNMT